ncbi:9562_t:CDS:2 [Ambispora gerdemannii]|uniref:Proteasome subunit beta n=1 Tax=Ambispora gerdemannii TaxID=144530 RepID=A0A9N8WAI9_9GLOM|nr:9562_t:CDS:2 [Ambispora gerdemannii]
MSSEIDEYNGGSVLAMLGKNCVAIASDKRFGMKLMTLGTEFPKIFQATDKIYIAMAGLATDIQTLSELIRYKINMYKLREEREIEPTTLAYMVASTLYERRFSPYYVSPLIAGLDKNNKPYICNMDLIGCVTTTNDFVVGGAADDCLLGTCEALYEPDLEPEDLFETISQSLISAVDRNAASGWGAVVHVLTPERVITRTLKTRQD